MRNMKSISGARGISHHALLWVDTEPVQAKQHKGTLRMRATGIRFYPIRDDEGMVRVGVAETIADTTALRDALAQRPQGYKSLQLWLARGWTDFVLSGLSELVEQRVIKWKWISIDGAKVLLDGTCDGLPFKVTSLSAWCGSRWDSWREAIRDDVRLSATLNEWSELGEDERTALGSVMICLSAGRVFRTGPVKLTIAAQARGWWRAVLGPKLDVCDPSKELRRKGAGISKCTVVAPIPRRPAAAAAAERQCCWGLVREQMLSGMVEGPIDVWDVRSSYLAALLNTPIPAYCLSNHVNPSVEWMEQAAADHTLCALVLLDSPERPYPVRLDGKPARAVGRYWTWLTGMELKEALAYKRVRLIESCWQWSEVKPSALHATMMLKAYQQLNREGYTAHVAFMRSLYSALVGQWARWGREWQKQNLKCGVGKWAAWTGFDSDTGELAHWRCVGGVVEKRFDRGNAPGAVPIVYATVLSTARMMVDGIAERVGWQHVVCICADSLWLTRTGTDRLRRIMAEDKDDVERFKAKETYDRVWLDGAGRAVVEKDGQRWPIVQGIPSYATIDADGRSHWMVCDPWTSDTTLDRSAGVLCGYSSFDANRIIKECSHKPMPAQPWLQLDSTQMREELLLPLKQRDSAKQGGIDNDSEKD